MKRRSKKLNRGILEAIGAAVLGVAAGAVTVFLSKEENRQKVKKAVSRGVRTGKKELNRAKRTVRKVEKKGKKAYSAARKRSR